MPTVKLDYGFSARTFPKPPAKFDPLSADDAGLLRYGFPERPTEKNLLELWESTLATKPEVVVPRFRPLDETTAGPAVFADAVVAHAGPEPTEYLGGTVVDADSGQGTVRWVSSAWTIPNIYPQSFVFHNRYFTCNSLIGIYENSDSSLFCGCLSNVRYRPGGNPQVERKFYPVWRWYPNRATVIENFEISPGDVISCVLCLDFESVVRARVYFHNTTSGQVTTFLVNAPAGRQLTGTRAGWIVQPMAIGSNEAVLARMGSMYFDNCNAGTTTGAILTPTTPIDVRDAWSGRAPARVGLLSDTLVKVTYRGYDA